MVHLRPTNRPDSCHWGGVTRVMKKKVIASEKHQYDQCANLSLDNVVLYTVDPVLDRTLSGCCLQLYCNWIKNNTIDL